MNAYTADQITTAQKVVDGDYNKTLNLRPLAEQLGITTAGKTRTTIWAEIRTLSAEIALLAPVDAEEEEEDDASSVSTASTTHSAPAPAPAPADLSSAEFAWVILGEDDEARKAEFIRLHEENERLTDLVRKLQAIPRASPITPSAAPAPKAKATKAVKAPKEPKEKAKPTARISTRGADLSTMLEVGESVFSKELINDGENKGQYRLCEARWLGAPEEGGLKGFGLIIDGELKGEGIKSPTTLVSAFRQWMNAFGESKQASSTTCGFAKCFVKRDGKEVRLISLIPQPETE